MNAIVKELKFAAMQGPRIYFAPLFGAIKAVRAELQRAPNKPLASTERRSNNANR
jgi:hypothetical protein